MNLENRVALVTGASKGIGKAIAHALANDGANIVLLARSSPELAQVSAEINGKRHAAVAFPCDVTDETQTQEAIDFTIKKFGRLDILVNNAGIGVFKKVVEMGVKEFDAMWRVNIRGVFLMTRAALPHMIKVKSGIVVNISSLAGKNSFVGGAGYSATKWALRGFASSLMLEVREYGIRVVTIFPGSVNTTFSSMNRQNEKIIQPEDVAAAVTFAVTAPVRSMFSEIDVRPTNPK